MNNQTFASALTIQARVLWALTLRDILSKNTRDKLGYFWQIIKVAFGLCVFWAIRVIMGVQEQQGLPICIFLLCGFVPWAIFSEIAQGGISAVSKNKALLTFSQVFELDLHIANLLVNWATQTVVMFILMWAFLALGYRFTLHDPLSFGVALVGTGLFGFGTGLCLATLCKFAPVAEYLISMVFRVMFFACGVFFSPASFGHTFSEIAYWNPLTNYIEMMRGAFLYTSPSSRLRITETIVITVAVLAVGMLMERHIRSIPDKV